MRYLVMGLLILAGLAVTILYSALVVASMADEEERKYWEERGG